MYVVPDLTERMIAAEEKLAAAEAKFAALEAKALNMGHSLSVICSNIDTASNHCCVNQDNNKLVCANTVTADVIGITEQTAGNCGPATDTICV